MIDTPEYIAALAEERRLREEPYLGLPRLLCGVECKEITPYLLARLSVIESPFIAGGAITAPHVFQFLWAVSVKCSTSRFFRWRFTRKTVSHLKRAGWADAVREIEVFVEDTFLDAPYGGKKGPSFVSSIAWLVMSMRRIMGWDTERTLHVPLREIYQYIRCEQLSNGSRTLVNLHSDSVRDEMMHAATRMQRKEEN